ncbi:MAG: radical SAM protein [Chloroflexi bacterium]|nr:radical SAM protein [Chloroflexota bacterium]
MRVLIVSANTLPASPAGPAYIAGAALQAGHEVAVFECLFAQDLETELTVMLADFCPDVVGISIRLVNGKVVTNVRDPWSIERFDMRPLVRQITDNVRDMLPGAAIVLGGPGFNYFGADWLDYLGLDYGIRGEGEYSFPLFLEKLARAEAVNEVPGCIYRHNGGFRDVPREYRDDLDATAFPAYQLFDLAQYEERGISPGISSKRGCALGCTFCPYATIEGTRYRVKSPARVVDEIEHIFNVRPPRMVNFCDNSFNIPVRHGRAICQEIIARDKDLRWGTGALKPINVTPEFVQLMQDSGCQYVGLSVESASPAMLQNMHRGYRVQQVRHALDALYASDLPFGVSLMLGAPGETPDTIAETFDVIDSYPLPPSGVWVTVGINLWSEHQQILNDARQAGQLTDDRQLFEGVDYLSPALPEAYVRDLVNELAARDGYTVQVNKAHGSHT